MQDGCPAQAAAQPLAVVTSASLAYHSDTSIVRREIRLTMIISAMVITDLVMPTAVE